MTIRVALADDAAALASLWREAGLRFDSSRVAEELAAVLERDSLVLVDVDANGGLAGSVLGTFDGRRGWVNRLAVRSSMRGRGIASALMTELERRLVDIGCSQVNLVVDRDNADAAGFYARLGYQTDDLIAMAKQLAGPSAVKRDLAPELYPEPYVYVTVTGAPPQAGMFAAIMEDEGLTLVLTKADADQAGLQYSYLAARITLRVNSALDEVGLTATVSRVLADAGISCNVIAGSAHDHLFVDWASGQLALDLLRQLLP